MCRHTPGNGLGLALVAAVARLHGMDIAIDEAYPGWAYPGWAYPGCRIVLSRPEGGARAVPDLQTAGDRLLS